MVISFFLLFLSVNGGFLGTARLAHDFRDENFSENFYTYIQ